MILRGGSESYHSRQAINAALTDGLARRRAARACVQVAPNTDRAYVAAMLPAAGLLDLIIPRGGKSLVERVQREARVPVLAHAEGLSHTYVHARGRSRHGARRPGQRQDAPHRRLRRHRDPADRRRHRPCAAAAARRRPRALGCDFRADAAARAICPDLPAAAEADFDTEWLDAVLSVEVVDGVDAALAHIARHGSEHTDAIVTEDAAAAEHFLAGIDCAVGCGTPPPSSATAGSSASAPRSASPPGASMRAARSGWSS